MPIFFSLKPVFWKKLKPKCKKHIYGQRACTQSKLDFSSSWCKKYESAHPNLPDILLQMFLLKIFWELLEFFMLQTKWIILYLHFIVFHKKNFFCSEVMKFYVIDENPKWKGPSQKCSPRTHRRTKTDRCTDKLNLTRDSLRDRHTDKQKHRHTNHASQTDVPKSRTLKKIRVALFSKWDRQTDI